MIALHTGWHHQLRAQAAVRVRQHRPRSRPPGAELNPNANHRPAGFVTAADLECFACNRAMMQTAVDELHAICTCQVVVGVVHNPILGETFTAVRGRGAQLNGQPISVTEEADLGSALVATEVSAGTQKSGRAMI